MREQRKPFQDLLEDIETAREVREILDSIYSEIGGYAGQTLSFNTLQRLNAFYRFDDSE